MYYQGLLVAFLGFAVYSAKPASLNEA